MSADALPPHSTPPAHVARLEQRVDEQHVELRDLKSRQGADRLALGHLAGRLSEDVVEVKEQLAELRDLMHRIAEKLGVS